MGKGQNKPVRLSDKDLAALSKEVVGHLKKEVESHLQTRFRAANPKIRMLTRPTRVTTVSCDCATCRTVHCETCATCRTVDCATCRTCKVTV
jgi:hypothetical protein